MYTCMYMERERESNEMKVRNRENKFANAITVASGKRAANHPVRPCNTFPSHDLCSVFSIVQFTLKVSVSVKLKQTYNEINTVQE